MGRNILFITTDQQRYDSLGCNGGTIARTPVVDGLAANGVRYERAYNQNTVCMPARSTMLTGQYVRTHGVVANGIALPDDAPSVAAYLNEAAGYRTALLGKAHFEPGFDLQLQWPENFMAKRGLTGPYRGFEHAELAVHVPSVGNRPLQHYGRWLIDTHGIDATKGFSPLLAAEPGGDTGAPETRINPIPRDWYHTDWVADRTIAFLDTLPDDADWFVWMSFPDPHHPWDPPSSELHRCNWRELDLPPGHPGSRDAIEDVLAQKPAHWRALWDGTWVNMEGGSASYRPQNVSNDSLREINAMTHIMNELIDEACGRVLERVAQRGWDLDTDVFFTTDHGELQGDYGLIFKGPFHVDSLMRLPMVWRPAPSAHVPPAVVTEPVGQLDLAPTFCEIAGVPAPSWIQGEALPAAPGSGRERVLCEWDSQFPGYGMHLRSIYRDGWLCTVYEPSTVGEPNGLEEFFATTGLFGGGLGPVSSVAYDGTEGELYQVESDPHQFVNRWDDPACAAVRRDLVADLYDNLPAERTVLKVARPA
ncbi:MAG: sulfatase-like hydrolase/transferase [Actinobacteria bacterium]|nr:sulfatase-like hydrolase/transferase [Actinomycetota bacterium]